MKIKIKIKIHEPTSTISGASTYKIVTTDNGVFVFRRLHKNEAEKYNKEKYRIDKSGTLHLYKIGTEENAVMAIKPFWDAIRKFNRRVKKIG